MDLRKSGLSIRNAKLQVKFQAFFLFLEAKNGILPESKTQIPTRKLKIGTDVKYRWLDTEHVVLNVQSHMICSTISHDP